MKADWKPGIAVRQLGRDEVLIVVRYDGEGFYVVRKAGESVEYVYHEDDLARL